MCLCFCSALALAMAAAAAAVAMPLPWNGGRTLQPISYTVSSCQTRSQYPMLLTASLREQDDTKHPARPRRCGLDVPPMTRDDLLLGLRATQVAHHLRRIDATRQVQVGICPRLDSYPRCIRSLDHGTEMPDGSDTLARATDIVVAELPGHARLDQTRHHIPPTDADRRRALDLLPVDR